MNRNEKIEIWGKRFIIILIIGAFCVNIKSIFTDYDVDVEYAVTMAYRLACGESLFTQMWEPHQTSAFLCALLLKPYLFLFNTTTGLVLYLNICSFLIYSAAVYFFYSAIKDKVPSFICLLMTLYLFTVRVKDVQILEFANMQILFSILLFSCLLKYYDNQHKKIWLVLGALSLCAEIVSYPSCIIVYLLVLVIIILYSDNRIKDVAVFSGVCIAVGTAYLSYFLCKIGLTGLLESFEHILASDNYHPKMMSHLEIYFSYFYQGIVWMIKCLLFSIIPSFAAWYILKRKKAENCLSQIKFAFLFIFFFTLMISDVYFVIVKKDRFTYIAAYLLMVIVSLIGWKYCQDKERKIVTIGTLIAIGSFFSTMLLTDLDFLSVVRYAILAIVVSILPLSKLLDKHYETNYSCYVKYFLLIMFIAVTIFRRGFMFKGESSNGYNLLDLGGIIKSGPELGIVTEYFTAYNKNQSMDDWNKYVQPSDSLLMVGHSTVDCINYLYEDVIISNPSSISTPTYTEEILEYWEAYPERFPTVIAVRCWFGQLQMPEDSWIMQWINDNYTPCEIIDGMYWRFYRLNN